MTWLPVTDMYWCWLPLIYKFTFVWIFSSVQFSRSVLSDSLRTHELQHARPPCPSPTPGVHANSCPSSPWCHPAISSSIVPFSTYPQTLPASESFPMSQLFAWSGQSTGVSALASVLPNLFKILILSLAPKNLNVNQWGKGILLSHFSRVQLCVTP